MNLFQFSTRDCIACSLFPSKPSDRPKPLKFIGKWFTREAVGSQKSETGKQTPAGVDRTTTGARVYRKVRKRQRRDVNPQLRETCARIGYACRCLLVGLLVGAREESTGRLLPYAGYPLRPTFTGGTLPFPAWVSVCLAPLAPMFEDSRDRV